MQLQHPERGNKLNFDLQPAKKNGGRQDCIIELEKCTDFGHFQMKDIQMGQGNMSLLALRQMVKAGRPAVVIVVPPGQKFEHNTAEAFSESMKRIGELKPVVMVFGGK